MDLTIKEDAFLLIIESNKGIIYKVVNAYCKDLEDRKDLFQEIVLQLWKSFPNYKEQFKHSTWIYKIALNIAISFYRKKIIRRNISDPFSESLFNLSDLQENNELETNLMLLQQFISELKELDKALILLYLDEKSYKEISEIIGISETNVGTKIHRIKEELKTKFSQIKS